MYGYNIPPRTEEVKSMCYGTWGVNLFLDYASSWRGTVQLGGTLNKLPYLNDTLDTATNSVVQLRHCQG